MSVLRLLNRSQYVSNHLYNNHLNKLELKAYLGERGFQTAPGGFLQRGNGGKKTPTGTRGWNKNQLLAGGRQQCVTTGNT